ILLALMALIAVWQIIWQPLSTSFIGAPTLARLVIVGISIMPIAFLMGIPFAVGLRIAGQLHQHYVAIAWTINGIFTVLGTVLGVVLALLFGYSMVVVAGLICYLVVLSVTFF